MVNFKSSSFVKELEENQENSSSTVMVAFLFTRRSINITNSFSFSLYNLPFYTVLRSRAVANITEANFTIQITQI